MPTRSEEVGFMRRYPLLMICLLLLIVAPSEAARLMGGGGQTALPRGTAVNDDLYISGGAVLVDGVVNGDLITAGGTVTINGQVMQDIIVAGGTVIINGNVGDDVRVAGGTVNINSSIAGDLVVAGGNVTVSGAGIGGDVLTWGGNTDLSAPISGSVMGNLGNLSIYNKIGGSVNVNTGMLKLGPGAAVAGSLTYTSSKQANINPLAKVAGPIKHNKPLPAAGKKVEKGGPAGFLFFLFWGMLSTIATGLVLIYLLTGFTGGVINLTWGRFWRNLGIGFLVLAVTPIAAVILMMTVIGIPLALILLASWLIMIYLARVSAAIFIGWMVLYLLRGRRETLLVWGLLLGALLCTLIGLIPVLGWIFLFGIMLAALGAIVSYAFGSWWGRYGRERREKVEAP